MKFLIYGAGAVGCYLGARLSKAGHEVVLITRPLAADRINQRGMTLIDASGQPVAVRPTAVSSLRQGLLMGEDTPFDYMFLTMKAYDIPAAINEMLAFCPQDPPTLVPLQNGIGTEEKLSEHYPEEIILPATCTVPVSLQADGNIHEERSDCGVALSSMVPNRIPENLVQALRDADVNTVTVKDYRSIKWSKLLVTSMGNATAAIVNRPPDVLFKYKPIFKLELRMIKEIQEVMDKMGVKITDLPGTSVKKLLTAIKWVPEALLQSQLAKQVSRGRGDKLPSFQMDLNAGKDKNEVLYHNGAVNQIGQELGVSTPVNGALTDILLRLVHQEVNWEIYDGKPKELVIAVNEYIRGQREATS